MFIKSIILTLFSFLAFGQEVRLYSYQEVREVEKELNQRVEKISGNILDEFALVLL